MLNIEFLSDLPAWLVSRGFKLSEIDTQEDAVRVLRNAMLLAPNDAELSFLFARLAFEVGLTEEAAVIARFLSALNPYNANYVGFSCQALYAIGNTEAAEVEALRLVELVKAGLETKVSRLEEILRILGEVMIYKKEYLGAYKLFVDLAKVGLNLTVCLTMAADAFLANGQAADATGILGLHASSNWSRTFVVASLSQFRDSALRTGADIPSRHFGDHDSAKSVSISSLAWYGRFAHQLSEYLLLYLYTKRNNLVLETPEWVGHYFFELDEPLQKPYQHVLRRGQRKFLQENLRDENSAVAFNVDIFSPGGLSSDDWALGESILPEALRETVQSRLKVRPLWMPYLMPALEKLEAIGSTIIAIHLRRGDRVAANDITPTALYLEWLSRTWPTLESPVLFLASDDINIVKQDFAAYTPYSLSDLTAPWQNNEYLQDFFILMNCNILGISTGGFGAYAALLNQRARLFLSPAQNNQSIITFDPYGSSTKA